MEIEFKNKFDEIISYKEGDLVMLRHQGEYGYYTNSWWRVMFIDSNNTFVGILERCHWNLYTQYQKGEHTSFNAFDVQRVYQEGQEFCYSDNITICSCIGLCREKY